MSDRTCVEPGCDKPALTRQLCKSHYRRLQETGRLDLAPPSLPRPKSVPVPKFPTLATFQGGNADDACWPWTRAIDRYGYGKVKAAKRWFVAHRVAYVAAFGEIPAGLVIDHLCRNRSCCNPAHMEPVTNAENIRRGNVTRRIGEDGVPVCRRGHRMTPGNSLPVSKHPHLSACRECTILTRRAYQRR